ncbi:exocyst complex component SEC15A-like [Olea europaea var. sylvestris]|uniref:exocyst complex component SEC15A-like n=1 Tax=Olea europaea var. sylvestris TaxID=158386 RepID=UPI000C1D5B60|nr:exocyst complex component SEC15A-like [Olea europaea var. sylvestris]
MSVKTKKRNVTEIGGDTGEESILMTMVNNGEDLGPMVRLSFETGKPESLLQQLKNVVRKKEVEIEDLCKLHYEDFILAVDELRGVLVDAEELKGELASDNFKLQEVSTVLLLKLEELLESYSIMKNVTEAIKMSKNCVQVLDLCVKCNTHISEGRFYPALKAVDLIENFFLHNIPVKTLKILIEKRMPLIKMHIEKRVCSEVNEWLVHIRSAAKNIGQTAIGYTASARQRDEDMLARQRKAEEQSCLGLGDVTYTLNVEEIDEKSVLGALEHVSNSIVEAFLSDSVKRFNANAVMSINHDLKALESFADDRFQSTGLLAIYKDGSFRDCLIEARQLINLLLSSQPENFMNPVIRQRNYNALDYKKVATICDKFKDSPDRLFGSLSNRNSKQSAQKKSMDTLKKRLKDFN